MEYNEKICSKFLFIAPISSGKTTLINALLGKKLLRSSNFACTSRDIAVLINNRLKSTRIYLEQENGIDIVARNIDDRKDKLVFDKTIEQSCKKMLIETYSSNTIVASKPIVFIDTPGGNYSQNNEHEVVTRKALDNFEDGIIIYVLNATQIGTDDDFKILSQVKSYINAKNKKVLFVLNKVDELDSERENLNNFISDVVVSFIEKVNITDYMIIPCASEAALLFRAAMKGAILSETECDKLYKYYKHFYKKQDNNFYATYESEIRAENSEVVYDGEKYKLQNLRMALRNTGIFELEQYISKVSTNTRAIHIKTKEKRHYE